MKEEIQNIIDSINWQVWFFNKYFSERKSNTNIIINPLDTAKIVKNACQMIIDNKDNTSIVNKFIEQIEFECYGDIFTEKESRLRQMPEFISKVIIEHCDKIINIYKSKSDSRLGNLNDTFTHKWLYKNNYESTSFILWISKISYKGNNIVWSGNIVELNTENCRSGWGINFNSVDEQQLDRIISYDDNSIDEIYNALNQLENLTDDKVKEIINNQIYWGFETMKENHYMLNLYEGDK